MSSHISKPDWAAALKFHGVAVLLAYGPPASSQSSELDLEGSSMGIGNGYIPMLLPQMSNDVKVELVGDQRRSDVVLGDWKGLLNG